mmetsp:Transcript_96490/g.177402  ORF Transcript_96490/g.177402 Transcript_96490/m.177402 type:complete len:209 (+) Transcript_96490:2665-3291(+)
MTHFDKHRLVGFGFCFFLSLSFSFRSRGLGIVTFPVIPRQSGFVPITFLFISVLGGNTKRLLHIIVHHVYLSKLKFITSLNFFSIVFIGTELFKFHWSGWFLNLSIVPLFLPFVLVVIFELLHGKSTAHINTPLLCLFNCGLFNCGFLSNDDWAPTAHKRSGKRSGKERFPAQTRRHECIFWHARNDELGEILQSCECCRLDLRFHCW